MCEFMASPDEETHAFILRFWREPRTLEGSEPVWRGVIEHVPTGRRHYVKDLNELVLFVISYVREMGVALGWRWRLWAWWQLRHVDGLELPLSGAHRDE